jgi:hypothetical protein
MRSLDDRFYSESRDWAFNPFEQWADLQRAARPVPVSCRHCRENDQEFYV